GPQASQRPELEALRAEPQQLVSRYVYEGNTLVVDFDATTVTTALRAAGLSLWGSDRPELLACWMTHKPERQQLVADAQESAACLQAAVQRRSLPVRLRLTVLTVQMLVTHEVLTAPDAQELRKLSVRYGVDALLGVQARQTAGGWKAR